MIDRTEIIIKSLKFRKMFLNNIQEQEDINTESGKRVIDALDFEIGNIDVILEELTGGQECLSQ